MTDIPATMTAIEITESGGPEVLKPGARDVPTPGEGEVLIKVAAAGINRPDVLQRKGVYPAPPGASDIPGLEIAGEVVALGAGVDTLALGDQVCALVSGGGYAEYCIADAPLCLPVPKSLSIVEAGALPETFFTVWNNVFDRSALKAGESFLIHGGTSGIGTTAIQLAKAFGAKVFATAGSAEKCQACLDLGADRAINYKEEDFVSIAKSETKGGVDVILDMVGGDYIQKNIKALRHDGRLCYIAFLGGSKAEIDLMPMMLKRLTLTGSTLRSDSLASKAAIAKNLTEKVMPLVEEGKVRPVMHSEFPLEKASEAHALMETNQHIGKIVLKVG